MSSDISQLLPRSAVHADASLMKAADQGAPGAANTLLMVTAVAGSVAGSVAAGMLVASMVMAGKAWRIRRRQQESEKVVLI